MFAIIETGGHQYRVREGDRLTIDRRPEEEGAEITFDQVLLIGGGEGGTVVGTPRVEGASVAATIEREYRGKKIIIRKYRRRKGYRRKRGHRQSYTDVRITGITAG